MIKYCVLLSFLCFNVFAKDIAFIEYDGPNCLNTALIYKGHAKSYRYTSLAEFNNIIHSPLCRNVENNSNISNLVGAVYSESKYAAPDIVAHGFIKIYGKDVFEKGGYAKTEAIRLTTINSVIQDYELEFPETSIKYFDCITFEQWIENQNIRLDYLAAFNEIEMIDSQFSQNSEIRILKLIKQIKKNNLLESASNSERKLLSFIAAKIISMGHQLSVWKKNRSQIQFVDLEFDETKLLRLFE